MLDRLKSFLGEIRKTGSTTTLGLGSAFEDRPALAPVLELRPEFAAKAKRGEWPGFSAPGITFPVDDVVPAADLLWEGSLIESTEMRSNATVLAMPDGELPCLAPEGYFARRDEPPAPLRTLTRGASQKEPFAAQRLTRMHECVHPLVQAVHLAFSQHRPLVLSPDAIWLTVAQGFGHHVNENAEALRSRLVRHEGKKRLEVRTTSLNVDSLPGLISQFSSQIRENSDTVLHETLVCEFSTTTPDIKTAYEIALMDSYQRYFDYGIKCVCGIPKVTLLGNSEDWRRTRERIEVLATYGLEWWTSRLAPILDQFVETAEGKPDRAFWQAIYKPQQTYGAELASGWIADLFPYLFGPPRPVPTKRDMLGREYPHKAVARRNHVLDMARDNWLLPVGEGFMSGNGVRPERFPSGQSRVPVELIFPPGFKEQVVLVGGFVGVAQRAKDKALAPIISWALARNN